MGSFSPVDAASVSTIDPAFGFGSVDAASISTSIDPVLGSFGPVDSASVSTIDPVDTASVSTLSVLGMVPFILQWWACLWSRLSRNECLVVGAMVLTT